MAFKLERDRSSGQKRIKEVVKDSSKVGLVSILAYSGKDVVRDPMIPTF